MSLNSLSDYTKSAIIEDKAVRVEGGYVNDPNDSGGATNFGVTLKTANLYKSYLQSTFNWDGTMQNFTTQMAVYVYDQEFWQKLGLDGIFSVSPLLADKIFDAAINCGVPTVAPWVQTCLNVMNNQQAYYNDLTVDGNIGGATVSALQALVSNRPHDGLANMLFMLTCKQGSYYIDLGVKYGKDEKFESGWQNRDRNQYGVYLQAMANG